MIEKLSFLNPLKPLPDGQETLATRVSAGALFVLAAEGLWGTVSSWLQRDTVLTEMRQAIEGHINNPAVENASLDMIGPGFAQGLLVFGVVQMLLFLALGLIQWRKPNKWIPLILFLFFAYSLLSIPQMLYLTRFQFDAPPWGLIRTVVETVVLVAIFWAGFRGGDRLGKLKMAATSANPQASSAH